MKKKILVVLMVLLIALQTVAYGETSKDEQNRIKIIKETMDRTCVIILDDVYCGTGILIKKNFVLTSYHVVSEFQNMEIEFNSRQKCIGQLVAFDEEQDLALIELETMKTIPQKDMKLGMKCFVGQTVYAFGSPLGLNYSVSHGIVSNDYRGFDGMKVFQIDAPVNNGNSGGAVINSKGELIGIVQFKCENQNDGLGFASCIQMIKKFLEENKNILE